MDRDAAWAAIDDQRRAVVRMLEEMSADEWEVPSLCEGWTVREVAAHLALQNMTWSQMPATAADIVRHRGMDGAIRAMASRHARIPVDGIIADIHDRIGVRRPLPTLTFHETAIDYVVHGMDIAVPLRRDLATSRDLVVLAADRVWARSRMFRARRRLAGHRLVADDVDWAVGQGTEVSGPIAALLLLLTGRPVALERLTGPGTEALRERLVRPRSSNISGPPADESRPRRTS